VSGPNPFDPRNLTLPVDYTSVIGEKVLATVPCHKPDKFWFVRVRPGPEWRVLAATIYLREEGDTFLVHPELVPELREYVKPTLLYLAQNRQGVAFIWPCRMPDPNGRRRDEWAASAHRAAAMAEERWVRVAADMSLGSYVVTVAPEGLPEPEWPAKSFAELLEICFRDTFVKDRNHTVLRTLRGEV
jgi:hypothetical protein